jgi:hypothetical protein
MTNLERASFEIPVGVDSLRGTSSGQLVGSIYISANGCAFPEATWVDFPAVILPWWSDALVSLLRREADRAEWLFMDGPYHVRLSVTEHDCLRVESVRVGLRGSTILGTYLVPTATLVRALRRAVNDTLRRISEFGHTESTRELSRVLNVLVTIK